ncbi:hypothetical protein ACWC9R_33995 [Streptomyces sp. NPDC001219]
MSNAPRPSPTPAQLAMPLSAIAATAATPRPSGETLKEQGLRAMRGITAQLSDHVRLDSTATQQRLRTRLRGAREFLPVG